MAIFMVIAAITLLSVVVTEMTYVAGVNKKMAYDGMDQLKALSLAKTGFKLSLLRLKAFQQVKGVIGTGKEAKVPMSTIEKIWSFPFIYPIPSVPGMPLGTKDAIEKFQKESGLEGRFTAVIEPESKRFQLNSVLKAYAIAPSPSPGPSASPGPQGRNRGGEGGGENGSGQGQGENADEFDVESARRALTELITGLLDQKFQADSDFAAEYRDFRVDDLVDGILAWSDPTYERKNLTGRETIKPKRAPFYSVNELHMVFPMDDQIFEIIAPNLTANSTPGININKIEAPMLKALVPAMKPEESDEFFKFRDDPKEDNSFKSEEDFFKWLSENVAALRDSSSMNKFKEDLKKRGIRLVIDEESFKITVTATVNTAVKTLEAWVTLVDAQKGSSTGTGTSGTGDSGDKNGANGGAATPGAGGAQAATPDSGTTAGKPSTKAGLKLTFMRIL